MCLASFGIRELRNFVIAGGDAACLLTVAKSRYRANRWIPGEGQEWQERVGQDNDRKVIFQVILSFTPPAVPHTEC
jgi:hypothetical protein